jgi:hypothetical protein
MKLTDFESSTIIYMEKLFDYQRRGGSEPPRR